MALNIQDLLGPMLDAAKIVVGKQWPNVQNYTETEMKKIGEKILEIEKMKLEGTTTDERAKLLLNIQVNASKTVLLAVKGITKIMAEQAINAALGAIRDVVNKAIGFSLL
jgi:inorganic pyrophosphatase/exopolyphosphatase